MIKENDQQLVYDYIKKGDGKSLEILIRRYLKPVYGFVYKYVGNMQEAEDITQDVFVKVWKNLKKFDRQRSFKAWIFTIAKNTAIDFLKKKKTLQFADFENERGENALVEKFIDPSPLPDELLERKGIREIFIKAAGKLFPKYRRVLLLRHEENMTFREIAESLGEPLNTVKSRHRRALIMLKKFLS
jgi:RNA polymerase sigma-70 factor (ECF subfamily)